MNPLARLVSDLTQSAARLAARWGPPFPCGAAPDRAGLPAALRQPLEAIRRRLVVRQGIFGLCLLVIVLGLLLPVQAAWDRLVDLPLAARAVLLLGDGLVVAAVVWRFVWRPWRNPPSWDACALSAEQWLGDGRSLLISGVQLSAGPSTPLTEAVVSGAGAALSRLSAREVVDDQLLRRPRVAAVAVLVLNVVLFVAAWPTSPVLVARLALLSVPLPTDTVIVRITGGAHVAAGDAFRVEVEVSGVIPAVGRIEISAPGQPVRRQPLVPAPQAPNRFVFAFDNVQESFSYRVVLNDARSGPHRVEVTEPPAVADLSFRQHYPAYTGLEPVDRLPGTMDLLAGSRLELRGSATQDLQAAAVVLGDRPPLPLRVEGATFSGDFLVPAEDLDGFSVVLTNRQGLVSRDNTRYPIRVIRDKPPEVVWDPRQPERRTLLENSQPQILATLTEDFGLASAHLVVAPDGAEEKAVRIPLTLPLPARSAAVDFVLKDPKRQLPWKEGAVFLYWIEVTDNNDVTGPGITRSAAREWEIVSRDAKRKELEQRLEKNARVLEELSKEQEDLRGDVGRMLNKP